MATKIPGTSSSYKYRDTPDFSPEYSNTMTSNAVQNRVGRTDTEPTHSGANHMMGQWVYEPHRQNHFELQICDMAGLQAMDYKKRTADKLTKTSSLASNFLTLSLNNFTMPDLKVGKITIKYGNSQVNYAGPVDNGDFNISFNDFVGLSTETILCAWFNTVYDPITEKLNYSNKYKHDAFLMEYNVDGGFGGCWKIEGLWINSFKPGAYGQENGNQVRKLECQFSYDRMYPYQLLDNNMTQVANPNK